MRQTTFALRWMRRSFVNLSSTLVVLLFNPLLGQLHPNKNRSFFLPHSTLLTHPRWIVFDLLLCQEGCWLTLDPLDFSITNRVSILFSETVRPCYALLDVQLAHAPSKILHIWEKNWPLTMIFVSYTFFAILFSFNVSAPPLMIYIVCCTYWGIVTT